MIAVVLFAEAALAADCSPLDDAGFRAVVADAKGAVDRDDLVGFADTRKRLLAQLPCLVGPVPPDVWARFLLDEAVVAFALSEAWEPALGTALRLDPDLPRTDLPQQLRTWTPGPPPPVGSGRLADGEFLVDGIPVVRAATLEGLHLVQRRADGVLVTRVVRDGPFPVDWLAPTVAAPVPVAPAPVARSGPRVPLVVTGLALGVVGAGVGVGSWAARGSVHDAAAGPPLVVANVSGWGAAAVGLAIGGIGLAGRR